MLEIYGGDNSIYEPVLFVAYKEVLSRSLLAAGADGPAASLEIYNCPAAACRGIDMLLDRPLLL